MTPDEHNPEGTDHAAQGHALAASKATPPAAAPTPTLPPEVREAIDAAAKKINWRLNTTHYVDIAGIIRDEIVPLWPRPAAVTADAEVSEMSHVAAQALARAEAAERERDRYFATLAGALFAGHFDKLTVAELREPGEKLIAERNQLRGEVETLLWNLAGCDAIASGHSRPGEFNADMARPALHSVSKLRQERDQLRAQLADARQAVAAAQEDKERMADLLAASLRYIPAGAFYGDFATMTKEEGSLVRQVGFAIATARGTNLDAARREGGAT